MTLIIHKGLVLKTKLLFVVLLISCDHGSNAIVPEEKEVPLEICFAPAQAYSNLPPAFNAACDESDRCKVEFNYESKKLDCFNIACIKTPEEYVFLIKSYSSSGSERTTLGVENVPYSFVGAKLDNSYFRENEDDGVLIRFGTAISDGDVGNHFYSLDLEYPDNQFIFFLDSLNPQLVHGNFSLGFKLRSEGSVNRPAPELLEFTEGSFSTYITNL